MNISDVGSDKDLAESGDYNDLGDADADGEGAGAQKYEYLAFGGVDMDLAHTGANKKLA
jgi:hypothetical protein